MDEQKPQRKHNSEWKDTPEQRAMRQRTRYRRQADIAKELGFSSWAALVTAIINRKVEITIIK